MKLPVVFVREMPFVAPFAETLWNVCAPPMPLRLTAMPVVLVNVFVPDTFTVPPPVALKPVLVVEVSESSLLLDRDHKGSLYARAGLADYWIVNLADRTLEVYRDPGPDPAASFGWRYRSVEVQGGEASVSPLALPGARMLSA